MAVTTKQAIKSKASIIKNETEDGRNTAARVGGLLEDMADTFASTEELEDFQTEQQHEFEHLQENLEEKFEGFSTDQQHELEHFQENVDELLEGFSTEQERQNDEISSLALELEGLQSTVGDKTPDTDDDLAFGDKFGYDIVRFNNGHIKTKYFDSENAVSKEQIEEVHEEINNIKDTTGIRTENAEQDLVIGDDSFFDIIQIIEGHVKTKHFFSKDVSYDSNKVKMLVIGNSYSYNNFAYLPYILSKISSVKLTLGIAYFAGRPIETHLTRTTDGVADYIYSEAIGDEAFSNKANMTLLNCLKSQDWDIIVFHQDSSRARRYESITPYFGSLIDWVISNVNKSVKLGWLIIPSWPNGYVHSSWDGQSSEEMYNDIANVAKNVTRDYPIELVFPCGTAIQNARNTVLDNLNWGLGHLNTNVHLQRGLAWQISAYAAAIELLNNIGNPRGIVGDKTRFTASLVNSLNIESEVNQGDVRHSTDANCYIGQKCAIEANKNKYIINKNII